MQRQLGVFEWSYEGLVQLLGDSANTRTSVQVGGSALAFLDVLPFLLQRHEVWPLVRDLRAG